MLEDRLKELFEELDIKPRPRTFGAMDVIHHGHAVRSRRRALKVAGSALGTTALVVAVGFALSGRPVSTEDPATPPAPAGTSHQPPTTQPSGAPRSDTPYPNAPQATTAPTNAPLTDTSPPSPHRSGDGAPTSTGEPQTDGAFPSGSSPSATPSPTLIQGSATALHPTGTTVPAAWPTATDPPTAHPRPQARTATNTSPTHEAEAPTTTRQRTAIAAG